MTEETIAHPGAAHSNDHDSSQSRALIEAIQVFQNINLLQIKRSYRDLLEMSEQALENFVQKHSDFVIFLLNILDDERAGALLERLTDSAIIYLSEEELRNLLIKQVGHFATHGRDFNSLSMFMDKVDRPELNALSVKKRISKSEADIIKLIPMMRVDFANRHFKYLESLNKSRRESFCSEVIERNVNVAIGLLLFCPDLLLVSLLDALAEKLPRLMRFFPDAVFMKRFEYGYTSYLRPSVRDNLPRGTQSLIAELIGFAEKTEGFMLKLIEAFADPELTAVQKRKIRLEELSHIISQHKIKHLKIAFYDLREIGVVEDADLELIQSLHAEHNTES
ncbi:MAG: hypothetical protein KDK39_14170 [Leptospiraceae bacterium]|nr:hypothetical protein [Leptospiraceae bacterium]